MKRLLLFISAVLLMLFVKGQGFNRAEYFFDSDPGINNGTQIILSGSNDSLSFPVSVPTAALSAGFHSLGLRVESNNNIWSLFEWRGFYSSGSVSNTGLITTAEYFIDIDPGPGNAVSLPVGAAGAVINFTAIIPTSLPTGFHFLIIRIKDENGIWSLFERRGFYVLPSVANMPVIIAAEYFIDIDPGFGNGTAIAIPLPGDTIRQNLSLPDTAGLSLGNHSFVIRYKDAGGVWSQQEGSPFSVCSTYGPLSKMTYQIEGKKVFFSNISQNADTITWKFGDNTISNLQNPIKTYNTAGSYNLQLITANSCGLDTLLESIQIKGLQRISPPRAANTGVTTISFHGFGFTSGMQVKILKGNTIINPVGKFFNSSENIVAYFNMNGQTAGLYDAVAVLGGPFDTLRHVLTIDSANPVIVSVSIAGAKARRPMQMVRYVNIFNHSNQDAIMVPYASEIGIAPQISYTVQYGTNANMVFLNDKGIFQNTFQYLSNNSIPLDVMSPLDIDSSRKKELLAYYKVKIPAASYTTDLIAIRNNTQITYTHAALVQPPLFSSSIVIDSIQSDFKDCMNSFLKKAVKQNLTLNINDAAWNSCFDNAFDTLSRTIQDIAKNLELQKQAIPVKAVYSTLLAQLSQCAASGMPASINAILFNKIVKDVTYNWLFFENLDSLGAPCFDTSMAFNTGGVNGKFNYSSPSQTGRFLDDHCPGAVFAPELAEECEIFTKPCNLLGELGEIDEVLELLGLDKVFEKFTAPFDKFCKVNTASVFCEQLCELTSLDPNQKFGPGNNSSLKYVNHLRDATFTIEFENLATASASAAYVEIRDTIDKNVFDIATWQTGTLGWGDSVVSIDANLTNISLLKDLRPVHPNFLRIDITLDTLTGVNTWKFWTLDTVNLQLTTDPFEGFLPPNTNGNRGVGFVTFNIKPKLGITSGSILTNKATILFDENSPIITPVWEYRIDTTRPLSHVNTLPATHISPNFEVNWTGTDQHSGIKMFSVYVSVDDSLYKEWKSLTTATADTFHGQSGHTYKFFSVALDKAGNFEEFVNDFVNNSDAFTTVINSSLPLNLLSFIARKTSDAKKVELIWTTANEQNLSHFEIQRSNDGINYVTISRIRAENNPAGATYTWLDENPFPKMNYYRLRMLDNDNSFKYSPVRFIRMEEKDDLLIFPTITNSLVFVQSDKQITIDLYNSVGIRLQSQEIKGTGTLDLSNLPSGIYFIQAETDGKKFKVIRQ